MKDDLTGKLAGFAAAFYMSRPESALRFRILATVKISLAKRRKGSFSKPLNNPLLNLTAYK
jgi:hypothetical protein